MKQYLSCIKSEVISKSLYYGRFALGYFSSGQGLTVANTLRRSLLSQLSGCAICCVYIHGSTHEYMGLVGVRECVLDILLNLKQITFCGPESFKPQIAFLNVSGPGIVRAKHLKLPYFLQCVDPEQPIATLNEKGCLRMKCLIDCGVGYLNLTPESSTYKHYRKLLQQLESKPPVSKFNFKSSFDQHQGYFPVEPVFSPVTKANYTIEAQSYELEIAYVEVWTNGAIDPKRAIFRATRCILQLFMPWQSEPDRTHIYCAESENDASKNMNDRIEDSVQKKRDAKMRLQQEFESDVQQEFHQIVLEQKKVLPEFKSLNSETNPDSDSNDMFTLDPIFDTLPYPNSPRITSLARENVQARDRARVEFQVPPKNMRHNPMTSIFLSELLNLRQQTFSKTSLKLGSLVSAPFGPPKGPSGLLKPPSGSGGSKLLKPPFGESKPKDPYVVEKTLFYDLPLYLSLPILTAQNQTDQPQTPRALRQSLIRAEASMLALAIEADIMNVTFEASLYVQLQRWEITTVSQLLWYKPKDLFNMAFTVNQISTLRLTLHHFLKSYC